MFKITTKVTKEELEKQETNTKYSLEHVKAMKVLCVSLALLPAAVCGEQDLWKCGIESGVKQRSSDG